MVLEGFTMMMKLKVLEDFEMMQTYKVLEGFRMMQLLKVLEGFIVMEELALQMELMKRAFGHPKENMSNAFGQRHMRFIAKEESRRRAKVRLMPKGCDNQISIQKS